MFSFHTVMPEWPKCCSTSYSSSLFTGHQNNRPALRQPSIRTPSSNRWLRAVTTRALFSLVVFGYASPQWSTSVLGSSFFNSAPMSWAQWPHQPRFRRPTLYRNTVNSGLRTTRYSFFSRRAVVCAVYDNAWASAGSTSDANPVRALARSLIDLSSLACARLTTSSDTKTKNSTRVVIYLLGRLHFALSPQQRNRKREIFSHYRIYRSPGFAKMQLLWQHFGV